MTILITGVAGFIGSALAQKFIENGYKVIGIDNLNSYYDVNLKLDRIKNIERSSNKHKVDWLFKKCDLEDTNNLKTIFNEYKPKTVINLAAQAGVRYSLENPAAYLKSNLLGFGNILEECRNNEVEHLIYASSSSVYGGNKNLPFREDQEVSHPVSLYAATKRSNELMAHSYSHIFGIPATGLRFFTVYGPWGRPDMAPMLFAKSIINKEQIDIFNFGQMVRDFTFIDDVVDGIFRCFLKPAKSDASFDFFNPKTSSSFAPHMIFNIGNSKPVKLLEFIGLLEDELGIEAIKNYVEMPPADVIHTESDTSKLKEWINYAPKTPIEEGIKNFVSWYKEYYNFK